MDRIRPLWETTAQKSRRKTRGQTASASGPTDYTERVLCRCRRVLASRMSRQRHPNSASWELPSGSFLKASGRQGKIKSELTEEFVKEIQYKINRKPEENRTSPHQKGILRNSVLLHLPIGSAQSNLLLCSSVFRFFVVPLPHKLIKTDKTRHAL